MDGTQIYTNKFWRRSVLSIPDLPLVNSDDVNGCDSIIDLTLEILDIFEGSLVEDICTPDGVILLFEYNPTLSTDISFIDIVWTDPNGDVLVDNIVTQVTF